MFYLIDQTAQLAFLVRPGQLTLSILSTNLGFHLIARLSEIAGLDILLDGFGRDGLNPLIRKGLSYRWLRLHAGDPHLAPIIGRGLLALVNRSVGSILRRFYFLNLQGRHELKDLAQIQVHPRTVAQD